MEERVTGIATSKHVRTLNKKEAEMVDMMSELELPFSYLTSAFNQKN